MQANECITREQIYEERLKIQIKSLQKHPAFFQYSPGRVTLHFKATCPFIKNNYTKNEPLYFINQQQVEIVQKQTDQNTEMIIIFVIVIPQKYPFQPPQIYCESSILFPRLDDGRNIFSQIYQRVEGEWWPNVSLVQIVKKVSEFLQKIKKDETRSAIEMGVYEDYIELNNLENINGWCICEGLMKVHGKYKEMWLGVSWSHLLILDKNKDGSKIKVGEKVRVTEITKMQLKEEVELIKKSSFLTNSKKILNSRTLNDNIHYFGLKIQTNLKTGTKNSHKIIEVVLLDQKYIPQLDLSLNITKSTFKLSSDRNFSISEDSVLSKVIRPKKGLQTLKYICQYVYCFNKIEMDIQKIEAISQCLEESCELEDATVTQHYRNWLKQAVKQVYHSQEDGP